MRVCTSIYTPVQYKTSMDSNLIKTFTICVLGNSLRKVHHKHFKTNRFYFCKTSYLP